MKKKIMTALAFGLLFSSFILPSYAYDRQSLVVSGESSEVINKIEMIEITNKLYGVSYQLENLAYKLASKLESANVPDSSKAKIVTTKKCKHNNNGERECIVTECQLKNGEKQNCITESKLESANAPDSSKARIVTITKCKHNNNGGRECTVTKCQLKNGEKQNCITESKE